MFMKVRIKVFGEELWVGKRVLLWSNEKIFLLGRTLFCVRSLCEVLNVLCDLVVSRECPGDKFLLESLKSGGVRSCVWVVIGCVARVMKVEVVISA